MHALRLVTLSLLCLTPPCSYAADTVEAPEEIVVVGRLPGPPLWRVSNGDNVLWIFPYLSQIPKDMIWESERVARVIAEAQESISMPDMDANISPLVMLNPINIFRGVRLARRISRNPDGATLQQSLPPELHERFAALQAQYFPGDDSLDDMRPLVAGGRMVSIIREEAGLESGRDILKSIRGMIRRNRDIKRTDVVVELDLEGGFGTLADRAETMMESLPPEQEQACFEQQVRHMEEDLDEMKSRANTWAQGYVDEFRNIPLVFDESDECMELMLGSSEQETMVEMLERMNQAWVEAAENALATNASSFAILPINDLLTENGLLSQLKAKGYAVREP